MTFCTVCTSQSHAGVSALLLQACVHQTSLPFFKVHSPTKTQTRFDVKKIFSFIAGEEGKENK